MAAEILLAGSALLSGLLAVECIRLSRRHRDLAMRLRRTALYHAEAARFVAARARLSEVQQFAEGAVAGGTGVVRAVHHGIAAIPFTILENIPVTRDTTKLVHGIHDLTADTVYGAITTINRVLGGQMRDALKTNSQSAAAKPPAPSRKN